MFNKKVKTVYMIGIKGAGMSSLAVILKKIGYQVTGSDTSEQFPTQIQLEQNKIAYFENFTDKNIKTSSPDLIVASTAYGDTNPEISTAKKLKIPVITYPEALGQITQEITSVAVSGSHGKTTTTAMLGMIMESAVPTVTLTGTVAPFLNKSKKKPKLFVFEADEYQNKFRYYSPSYLIVTNIDYDHPDFFKDSEDYRQTFKDFALKTLINDGVVVYNADDKETALVLKEINGKKISFGLSSGNYQIKNINKELDSFSLFRKGRKILDIELSVYGKHNILDAATSAVLALELKVPAIKIKKALKKFPGTQRRLEIVPNEDYTVIIDYAHHPTEVTTTLEAIRNKYRDKNIVTVFHAHTFSRTKLLLKEFGKSFENSDLTLIMDIFPSAREKAGGIHAKDLVDEIDGNGSRVIYTPTPKIAASCIKREAPKGSVVILMGAGDAWQIKDLL